MNWDDEENWTEERATVGDDSGPYLLERVVKTSLVRSWNPKYDEDAECICGHSYYRHFDTYENMDPVGCKYCGCGTFTPAKTFLKEL